MATFSAVDAENDPLTFAVMDSSGTEVQDSNFEIVGDEIRVKSGADVDFETLNPATLFIVVSDSTGSSGAQRISLTLNDLAETIQLGNGGVVLVDTGVAETRIIGGTGNDDITANNSSSTIDASGGNDIVRGGVGNDRILGSSGDDNLSGGLGDDTLNRGDGNDTINGGGGNDRVFAEAGNDIINGGSGNAIAFGGNDNDTILGGIGDDTLDGSGGDDFIDGEDGDDTVVDGTGADALLWVTATTSCAVAVAMTLWKAKTTTI